MNFSRPHLPHRLLAVHRSVRMRECIGALAIIGFIALFWLCVATLGYFAAVAASAST